jgi:hypothetical protein
MVIGMNIMNSFMCEILFVLLYGVGILLYVKRKIELEEKENKE